jgi:hypothetical protein
VPNSPEDCNDGGRGQGPLATLDQDLRTAAPALNIELLVA